MPQVFEHIFILVQYILITLCFSTTLTHHQYYLRVLPGPYVVSLICRWLFPYIVRRSFKNRRKNRRKRHIIDSDEDDEELAVREKKPSLCRKLCNPQELKMRQFPFLQMVTVIIRLSILAILLNFSLKLTGVLNWSYYILLWPYYVFLGISITCSCGSLLFLF